MNESTARNLQYTEAYEEENFVPVVKPVKENVVLKEIRLKKAHKKVKSRILVKVSLLVMLGLGVAFRYASITEINYQNQKLQKEYETLKAQVLQQQTDMNSQMSITEIAQIAEEKLNMQKPQPYQIVHIKTDVVDQTEVADVVYTQSQESRPWYQRAWDAVLEFFGII